MKSKIYPKTNLKGPGPSYRVYNPGARSDRIRSIGIYNIDTRKLNLNCLHSISRISAIEAITIAQKIRDLQISRQINKSRELLRQNQASISKNWICSLNIAICQRRSNIALKTGAWQRFRKDCNHLFLLKRRRSQLPSQAGSAIWISCWSKFKPMSYDNLRVCLGAKSRKTSCIYANWINSDILIDSIMLL